MGNITSAIEKVVRSVLSNLDVLTVNRIRTKARHKMTIENGAGAWIVLDGDKVLISHGGTVGSNDGIVDRLYFGADMLCWIERNPNNGNLTFHAAPGRGIEFERGS